MLRWLDRHLLPLKVLTLPISWILLLCVIAVANRVGVGNDDMATKEWLLGEICKLSSLEFFRLADRLKLLGTAQFGSYD